MKKTLLDLRDSMNLMPMSMMKRIGYLVANLTKMTL